MKINMIGKMIFTVLLSSFMLNGAFAVTPDAADKKTEVSPTGEKASSAQTTTGETTAPCICTADPSRFFNPDSTFQGEDGAKGKSVGAGSEY